MLKDFKTDCPTVSQLQGWIDGSTDDDVRQKISQHLSKCTACTTKVDNLSDDPEMRSMLYLVPADVTSPEAWNQPTIPDRGPTDSTVDATPITDVPFSSLPTKLDHYLLDRQLGDGTFAHVFSAWDETLERTVAVKCLKPERSSGRVVERFIREAKALAGVECENVVRVLRAPERTDEYPYLVLELVDGGSLSDWLETYASSGPPSKQLIKEAVELVRDAAVGLCVVHAAGLVHRDLKPSNILVSTGNESAKLADFGLAHDERQGTLTQTAEMIGTPAYMSPEQAEARKVDARTDVYSLGATLYQLLTGQAPFQGTTPVILRQIVEREPIPPRVLNPNVAGELECICLKAIEKHPGQRYQTSRDFLDDLNRWLEGRPVLARPLAPIGRFARWYTRNLPFAVAVSILLGSLILGTVTTTWLWLSNAGNARLATKTANDLQANRAELRSTVSRFQERIYSDEGLHWQLAPTFRRDMFTDFLSYLDKFAEVTTSAEDVAKEDVNWSDELARDYLMIAETALLVRDFEIARTAADRTLDHISPLVDSSVDTLLLRSRAAEVAFWCAAENKKPDRNLLSEYYQQASDALKKASSLAEQADELKPQLFRVQFLDLQLQGRNPTSLERATELARAIREFAKTSKLHPVNTNRRKVLPTGIQLGWFIAETFPDSEPFDVLRKTEQDISSLREATRAQQKPLYICDYFQANNKRQLAILCADDGDISQAIEEGKAAMISYRRALTDSPHNFPWRHQAAMLHARMGDWLAVADRQKEATVSYHHAVTEFVSILRNDPLDNQIRYEVIRMLAKKAELSEKLGSHADAAREFYMAAQDFRHFLAAEEIRDRHHTFYEARLWLLAQAFNSIGQSTDSEYESAMIKVEEAYITYLRKNKPHLDVDQHAAIVDGTEYNKPMPELLEFRYP